GGGGVGGGRSGGGGQGCLGAAWAQRGRRPAAETGVVVTGQHVGEEWFELGPGDPEGHLQESAPEVCVPLVSHDSRDLGELAGVGGFRAESLAQLFQNLSL